MKPINVIFEDEMGIGDPIKTRLNEKNERAEKLLVFATIAVFD